jgi:hypothetical protein
MSDNKAKLGNLSFFHSAKAQYETKSFSEYQEKYLEVRELSKTDFLQIMEVKRISDAKLFQVRKISHMLSES